MNRGPTELILKPPVKHQLLWVHLKLRDVEKARQGSYSGFVHPFVQTVFSERLVCTRRVLGPADPADASAPRGTLLSQSGERRGRRRRAAKTHTRR